MLKKKAVGETFSYGLNLYWRTTLKPVSSDYS